MEKQAAVPYPVDGLGHRGSGSSPSTSCSGGGGVTVEMLTVTLASLVVIIGMSELLIRRAAPLRALFGMKARPTTLVSQPQEAMPVCPSEIQPSV